MSIISLNNQIEKFVNKHDLMGDAGALKKEHAISSSEEWQKVLDELEESGRVLRIGIVGRVKAGKSSLLNALIFNGQDILPKAATPMTAALTIMKYSEKVRAEIDFFTEQDINEIKNRHDQYIIKFNTLKNKYFSDMQERLQHRKSREKSLGEKFLSQGSPLSASEIKDCQSKAERQAEREMKEDAYYASFDQYKRIKATKKSPKDLAASSEIHAESISSLMNGELNKYVGSSGELMPFTKSVTLHIPHPGLEGLEIIDTPGINDPVTSREERTEQLLQHCDVVLVVSPSGQFLSSEDTDLLQRITTKEGTQEAYFIASQVDNQLFGSEKGNSTDPIEVLGRVSHSLTNHARGVLNSLLEQNPEMKVAADKLRNNDVICSSSVAHALEINFEDRAAWDENMQHVWGNLTRHYPAAFEEAINAKDILNKLASIQNLTSVMDDVTGRKSDILKQRRINFEQDKYKALQSYLESWKARIEEQVQRIETADVNVLREQEKKLSLQRNTVITKVGDLYSDLILELKLDLDQQMKEKLSREMRQYDSASENAQGTKQESREVYKGRGGFLWLKKKYETEYYEVNTVRATSIRRAIEEVRGQLEDSLSHIALSFQQAWKINIYKQVVGNLREIMGDDNVDISVVTRAVKGIMAAIPEADFYIEEDLPSEIKKSGTLSGSEAEDFISAADNYVSSLNRLVREDIKNYMTSLLSNLERVSLASDLTDRLKGDLEQLVSEIENKEASLYRYQKMDEELNSLMRELG